MKFIGTTSVLALISLAGPTMAFDIGGGFALNGKLEYERLSDGSDEISVGILDADLTYEHASGFGGFVGVNALSYAGSSSETFYGALSYSGDFGKIQIGAPRNALDDYMDVPAIAGVDLVDLQFGIFSGSILPATLFSSNETALGLRYDGSFGATSVGLSYHDIDGDRVLDLAMNYRMGETVLKAGVEHIKGSSDSATAYFLGAEHDFGQVTAGAVLGHSDLIGGSTKSIQAYATYSPTDRLDLTASVLNIDSSGPNGTIYGLTANYDLHEMVYVEAGYMDTSSVSMGGDDFFALTLGVKF